MSPSAEEETIILPYGQRESVELILREHKDEIGGVFFDAKAGIYDIDPDFVHFLSENPFKNSVFVREIAFRRWAAS